MLLEPLSSSPSLNEQAYEAIKGAILSLTIRPGEVLAIGSLADQLGVSRTPVRDALLHLEADGLVTVIPQKGAYVTEISETDIREMYELRILLESYAARVAATRLTKEELEFLEEILQEAERAFQEGNFILTADRGRDLHDLLVKKVGNSRFEACLSDLDTQYTRVRRAVSFLQGRFERSQQQHNRILDALKIGNPDEAEKAMTDHLSSVCEDLLASADIWQVALEKVDGEST